MKVERSKIGRIIPSKVSEKNASRLEFPITKEEIKTIVLKMHNDEAVGPGGLKTKFDKEIFSWIEEELLQVYEESFSLGTLGRDVNIILIKLIPKEGDKTLNNIGGL